MAALIRLRVNVGPLVEQVGTRRFPDFVKKVGSMPNKDVLCSDFELKSDFSNKACFPNTNICVEFFSERIMNVTESVRTLYDRLKHLIIEIGLNGHCKVDSFERVVSISVSLDFDLEPLVSRCWASIRSATV